MGIEKIKPNSAQSPEERMESLFAQTEGEREGSREDVSRGDFEAKKGEIMDNLNAKIKELNEKGYVRLDDAENRLPLKFDKTAKDRKKFSCEYNGKKYKLTPGDILSDYNWGVKYAPSQNMPDEAYRQTTKRILTNEARRDLEDLRDKEMVSSGEIRKGIARKFEQGKESQGRIAEDMIRELMTRTSYSLSRIVDYDIKIERASEEEDLFKKIDFKIIALEHGRGVKTVDEEDSKKAIQDFQKMGLQIAVSGSKSLGVKGREEFRGYLLEKTQKIKAAKEEYKGSLGVDDVLLLNFRLKQSKEKYYDRWVDEGRPPGGPEAFISTDKKKEIFKTVTQGLKLNIDDDHLEKILK